MERLSALDASFLHLETTSAPMHLGWVGIFEGPAPALAEIAAPVDANLGLMGSRHHLREVQRLVFVAT